MGKKGRHGRSKSRGAAALVARVSEKPAAAPPPVSEQVAAPVEVAEAAAPEAPEPAPAQVAPQSRPRIETPIAFAATRVVEHVEAEHAAPPHADLDSPFFSDSSPTPLHGLVLDEPSEERDPRMALKMTPAAARRRAQLQKYVRLAVGASAALCLAALVKVAVARNHDEPAPLRAAAAAQVAPPPAAPRPVVPVATALPIEAVPPPADVPAAEPPVAPPEPAPAPAEAPAAPAAVAADVASAPPADTAVTEPDPKAAAKAKHASQLALERGKIADAIEAGEQSVALDPSDAEAWLILGAAYQEKGDTKSSRRSFKACLEQGKRGPKWECAQFPH